MIWSEEQTENESNIMNTKKGHSRADSESIYGSTFENAIKQGVFAKPIRKWNWNWL
jgi:hypothetical protein